MSSILLLIGFVLCSTLAMCQAIPVEQTYRVVAIGAAGTNLTSESNEIDLALGVQLHFPTAFTPNGDGLNDTFGPVGQGIEGFSMTVFDRWGKQVFETNDPNRRWDGMYAGSSLPAGAYAYKVVAHNRFQAPLSRSGAVMLVK